MQRPPLFVALEHPKHLATTSTHLPLTAARLVLQCLAHQAVQFADNLNILGACSAGHSAVPKPVQDNHHGSTTSALSNAKKLPHTLQPLLMLLPSTGAPAL